MPLGLAPKDPAATGNANSQQTSANATNFFVEISKAFLIYYKPSPRPGQDSSLSAKSASPKSKTRPELVKDSRFWLTELGCAEVAILSRFNRCFDQSC
jgi:hypothetical protein